MSASVYSYDDFCEALLTRNIVPPDHIVADGQVHRCDVEGGGGDGRGDGSYLLRADGSGGWYQNWQDGLDYETWHSSNGRIYTPEELEELRQSAETARQQRQAEDDLRRAGAAKKAAAMWAAARPSDGKHPYLLNKNVQPHGLRVASFGPLLVPLFDADGTLCNLQTIAPDGSKLFLKDGRVGGCYFSIGGVPANTIMIGEGFSTCASSHEATAYPAAVAFGDKNMLAVARILRGKFPNIRIVLLADDDDLNPRNPGLVRAHAAAAAVGGIVAIPDFGATRPAQATDFNDLAQHSGRIVVRQCIEAALLAHAAGRPSSGGWTKPDMSVVQLGRRVPPTFPIAVLGPAWERWVANAANAAAAPVDYVVAPLLSSSSVLVGNARWPLVASARWSEPSHLWTAAVGDSGDGKSPGADALMGEVLPVIEQNMLADHPSRLEDWRVACTVFKIFEKEWEQAVKQARKNGGPMPTPPTPPGPEPREPTLVQTDVTIERVATLLASSAPKGLLIYHDELAGWIAGMNNYNDAGRAFWLMSFGGRRHKVERQKAPAIIIPHLAVAVYGSVQPDRLAILLRPSVDDGLLARLLWFWPDPIRFHLGTRVPDLEWAVAALDRLRLLEMAGDPPRPMRVPLAAKAVPLLEEFARHLEEQKHEAGGLMRSALGKGRGLALRLSLVLEFLWWSGVDGADAPPTEISAEAFLAAAAVINEFFMPMARRVYGDAALPSGDRNTATLARWILREQPSLINARDIRRKARLPGLSEAARVDEALTELVAADWLIPIPSRSAANPGRQRADYAVNPQVFEGASDA